MARERETRLAYSTAGETEPVAVAAPASGTGNIRLRLDRRASGRLVTVVTGLPGRPGEVLSLAKILKAAAGAGGTVKGGALELQGDHRDLVEGALLARGLRSKRSGG
jgi:translation initiation factor 1